MTAVSSRPTATSLRSLPGVVRDDPALLSVLGQNHAVLAVPEPARAVVISGLVARTARRPVVVATASSADAENLAQDLRVLLDPDDVELFPAWETLPFERVSPGVETMGRRIRTLQRLADAERMPAVVVAPVRSFIQRLAPGSRSVTPVEVRRGGEIDLDELADTLVAIGYRREYQVEHRGEFAVRGSIVDVFPPTAERPVRIDLWGDEVDRLSEFSVTDQRSTDDVDVVEILPCRELLPTDDVRARAEKLVALEPWGREHWERLAEGQLFDGMESWLPWLAPDEELLGDLLPDDAQLLLVEPRRLRDRAGEFLAEEADLANSLARTWGAVASDEEDHDWPTLHLPLDRVLERVDAPTWHLTTAPEGPDVATVQAFAFQVALGDEQRRRNQLRDLQSDGYRIVVAADGEGSAARLRELLDDIGVDGEIVVAPIERGCVLPGVKLALLAESDLTGRRRSHRRARPRRRDAQQFFDGLKAGDNVVHHQHGVAKYGGMVKRAIGGVERDYLLLEYKGGDKLYVPSDQIDAVRHYTGGETPTLTRLGGDAWTKTKARVRSEVTEIAQELVVLYQKRLAAGGHAYSDDTPWQAEFEQAFPYEPTPDQLRAVEDIKADMEREVSMDRLVVGDVGFGKTEVALRAMFKAVQDGKQAAVLVPTTLLAQQHFQTFTDRFASYPLRVEMLSRFLTNAQAREVIGGVRNGSVDVVVGTHRLLNKDVVFKELGLLVVDEEQRFGVKHKERIKELKADVDVLTLTATPIPRTLEMSLTGIRDMSLLDTPPADRQPILTYVGEYDERAAAEAIRRELLREGQVFFVHNRVADIDRVAGQLRELVPEARIAVAHGQLDEGTLEQVVIDFWDGHFDVLVCTTIIESGIDMPTVNTLVVDRADLLGLGQLHQLRGRVGRAGSRAYAYLFHPQDMVLSEDAYERLRTIGESTELGSGFRIAMRDLEIRGAGNLLGTGQSGHVAAVGYDLYVQMINEAVAELKGEPIREPAEVKIDLPTDAHLSADYVEKEELRLEAYRRLAAVASDAEVDDIAREWEDRYGTIPDEANALLDVARLRAECHRLGITEVAVVAGDGFMGPAFKARLSPVELKASQSVRLTRIAPKAVHKPGLGLLEVPMAKGSDPAVDLVAFLRHLLPPE
ncbi:MAG: transcription-repair coupling factor [Acidimicrobiales bacterium]|nr:transcription-repair coupling factor [Acidimicrobiales bacterium]